MLTYKFHRDPHRNFFSDLPYRPIAYAAVANVHTNKKKLTRTRRIISSPEVKLQALFKPATVTFDFF